jgi:hypothetical protein
VRHTIVDKSYSTRLNSNDPFLLKAAEELDQEKRIASHHLSLLEELLVRLRLEDVRSDLGDRIGREGIEPHHLCAGFDQEVLCA